MTTKVIAKATKSVRYGNGREFVATAELDHIEGNRRPHFSVTGEDINLRRRGDNRVEACGQLHDEVLRFFPEWAPLVAMHLADDRGVPMYAVENGAYWLGLDDPRFVPEGAPRLDVFAALWRVDEGRARELYEYAKADAHPREALEFLAKGEAARWLREADEALLMIGASA